MTELLPCPFCGGVVQFRKALWPSDGNVDAIIHAEPTECGLADFSDDTTDESILVKWNAALAARQEGEWQPIDTVPDGERVELFLEHGEKGNGEIAVGMVFRNDDGSIPDHYWTWGGPNSGLDVNERPTHWRHLRPFPDRRPEQTGE